MTGRLALAAGGASQASLLVPAGSADPVAPAPGELWNNGHVLKYRTAGATRALAFADADLAGNAGTADRWKTPRTLSVTGAVVIDGSENESLALTLDAAGVRLVALPPGAISAFATASAPAGWLECDGAVVSRATYAGLFAAIGTSYGAGDGSTTFRLPDLRGEFVRGWDHGRGVDAGRAQGSAQADMVGPHVHGISTLRSSSQRGDSSPLDSFSGGASGPVASTLTSPGAETRPRNVALLYAVKT
ncbi:phage tail protein [Caulobacter sp. 17J65-9]|nr:phage tail protein [Caulobacter sp. 17J65-9]